VTVLKYGQQESLQAETFRTSRALILSDVRAIAAGVFTTTRACRQRGLLPPATASQCARAILCNAGQANAATVLKAASMF